MSLKEIATKTISLSEYECLQAEIRRLRNFIAAASHENLLREAVQLRADVHRLRTALKPFSLLHLPDYIPDNAMVILTDTGGGIIPSNTPNHVSAKDVREAHRALWETQ